MEPTGLGTLFQSRYLMDDRPPYCIELVFLAETAETAETAEVETEQSRLLRMYHLFRLVLVEQRVDSLE